MLDVFSSDAIPVHLLTLEAFRLYRLKLAEGGLLAFHLSNRFVDLDPVIRMQASAADMACRVRHDLELTEDERRAGKQPSIWAVLARREADLGILAADRRWQVPRQRPGARPWTDDFSNLASYLLWWGRRIRAFGKPSARCSKFLVFDLADQIGRA